MDPDKFLKDIEKGKIPSILVFHGEEEYLKDWTLDRIRRALIPDGMEDLNYSLMDGKKTAPSDIDAACQTLPFMADRRMVVVRDFEPLAASRKSRSKDDDGEGDSDESGDESVGSDSGRKPAADDAAAFAERIPDTVCLVFFSRGKVNTRGTWYRRLTKAGADVRFAPLKETDAASWIIRMARELDKEISRADAITLFKAGNGQLAWVRGEIDKLAAYVGERPRIGREDIELICAQSAEYRVFRMIDQLVLGRERESMAAYRHIVAAGDSPHMVLALVSRQLAARMWALTLDEPDRQHIDEAARVLRVPGFVVENAIRNRARINMDALREAVEWCDDTDHSIKTGLVKDESAIELLMMKIVHRMGRGYTA